MKRFLLIIFLLKINVITWADERADFIAAEQALQQNDLITFNKLSVNLQNYPLYIYLRANELKSKINFITKSEILDFLAHDPDSPPVLNLRKVYLNWLAAHGQWKEYIESYRPHDSTAARCYYARALIETNHADAAWPLIEPLWLTGNDQPAACDFVFKAWKNSGLLTTTLVWQRIRLCFENKHLNLARALNEFLPESEQVWLERWLSLDRDPKIILATTNDFESEHPFRAAMLAHGIVRLAAHNLEDANLALTRWNNQLLADGVAFNRAVLAVGQALSQQANPQGLLIFDKLQVFKDNLSDQEIRIRTAIRFTDWDQIKKWISQIPDSDSKRERWLYWQGRAEEQLGNNNAANTLFAQAAQYPNLWGILAAERLQQTACFIYHPTPADPERIRNFLQTPAYQRIRELNALERNTTANREWRGLSEHLTKPDLLAAAYVADALSAHSQAITLSLRAGYREDLDLRFPLQYQELIFDQAQKNQLDPAWILAVIRQESVFAPAIASPAGAVGLMQLMPATAREIAQRLGLPSPSRKDLNDPSKNITLGSAYLTKMRARFNHLAVATAAYNAGPQRVASWLPQQPIAADLWIARIPFNETRTYVERVLAYRVLYARRLGQAQFFLSALLPPISILN